MKSILKTIVILSILFSLIFAANWWLQNKITNNGLKLEEQDKILIFGDSHGVCSFNPKYISKSKNLSNYGESLVFSYFKLKKILKNNNQTNDLKVMVSLSHHSLYKCRENYKIADQRTNIIQEYYPILEEEGINLIGRYGMDYYLTKLKFDLGIPFNLKTTIDNIRSNTPPFITGYNNKNVSNDITLDHSKLKFKDHFQNEDEPTPSVILLNYLNKIIELTNKSKIPLILVNTPKHKLYLSNALPSSASDKYQQVVDSLINTSPHIHFLDLSNLLANDSLYRDTDHVNSLGAKLVSIKIDSFLNTLPNHFN